MSRYEIIIAEANTGIVRRADAPELRFLRGAGGEQSRFVDSESDAFLFRDRTLRDNPDVEVTIRSEGKGGGTRFYMKDGALVGERYEK